MIANTKIDEALAKLEARRGNKWRYAVIRGVLLWGLPCWLGMTLIEMRSHDIDRPLEFALITLPPWVIGGFLFALWHWRFGLWPVRLGASIYKRFHRDVK